MNHSCHHPPTHKIPVEEVIANPKALHNTKHKKERMRQMLAGERPKECDYCWRVEDQGEKFFSDRTYKSQTSWAMPYIYDVLEKNNVIQQITNYYPKYRKEIIEFYNIIEYASKCGRFLVLFKITFSGNFSPIVPVQANSI